MRSLVLLGLFFAGTASAQSLSVSGSCGGVMTFNMSGLTAGGQWALISAAGPGGAATPGGPASARPRACPRPA